MKRLHSAIINGLLLATLLFTPVGLVAASSATAKAGESIEMSTAGWRGGWGWGGGWGYGRPYYGGWGGWGGYYRPYYYSYPYYRSYSPYYSWGGYYGCSSCNWW